MIKNLYNYLIKSPGTMFTNHNTKYVYEKKLKIKVERERERDKILGEIYG